MVRNRASESKSSSLPIVGREDVSAVIYCRISSDPLGERAGVERQRQDCEALAAKLGVSVVHVYVDNDISAYSGKIRPAFESMLTDAAEGQFQLVIVWATDRLYRRMTDLTRITDELAPYAKIASVNGGEIDLESSEGILRAQVLGSVAEFESRRKSERIGARAKQRAENGVMTSSHRPFGWTWARPCPGGVNCEHPTDCEGSRPVHASRRGLIPHPTESTALADTYRNIAAGASIRSELKRLRAAGHTLALLLPVLKNPRNAGLVAHHGVIVADDVTGQSIVSRELWDTVQAILADPSRRTSPNRPAGTILGGGLLKCALCGSNMASGRKRFRPTYICSRNYCVSRLRPQVDAPVLDLVGDVVAALTASGNLQLPAITDDPTMALRAAIAADEGRLDALAALMSAGELDPADYAKSARLIRVNLATTTAKLTRRANRPALAQLGAGDVGQAWNERRTAAEAGDIDWMRAALRELLDAITLDRDRMLHLTWKSWVGPAPDRLEAVVPTPMPEHRKQVRELTLAGMSGVAIARKLDCNRGTVVKDLRLLRAAGLLPAGPKADRKVT